MPAFSAYWQPYNFQNTLPSPINLKTGEPDFSMKVAPYSLGICKIRATWSWQNCILVRTGKYGDILVADCTTSNIESQTAFGAGENYHATMRLPSFGACLKYPRLELNLRNHMIWRGHESPWSDKTGPGLAVFEMKHTLILFIWFTTIKKLFWKILLHSRRVAWGIKLNCHNSNLSVQVYFLDYKLMRLSISQAPSINFLSLTALEPLSFMVI